MTVLLVLLFLIIALGADAFVQYKKNHQEIYHHGNGICPTMADGGEKVK